MKIIISVCLLILTIAGSQCQICTDFLTPETDGFACLDAFNRSDSDIACTENCTTLLNEYADECLPEAAEEFKMGLGEVLANYSPGDEVNITLNRDGELIAATVTLGAHPDDEDKAYLGVSIMPLERLRMHMKQMQDQNHEERQSDHESQSSS